MTVSDPSMMRSWAQKVRATAKPPVPTTPVGAIGQASAYQQVAADPNDGTRLFRGPLTYICLAEQSLFVAVAEGSGFSDENPDVFDFPIKAIERLACDDNAGRVLLFVATRPEGPAAYMVLDFFPRPSSRDVILGLRDKWQAMTSREAEGSGWSKWAESPPYPEPSSWSEILSR